MKTNQEEFELQLETCFKELSSAYKEKYEPEKAERTAALFLAVQMQLAVFIADIELRARHAKHEIERVEAEKYFQIRDENVSKKITEATLTQSVAKDKDVIGVKKAWNEAESELKKYNYLLSGLKDGHYYFKSLLKKASEF